MNRKLLALVFGLAACDGRFDFDVPSDDPVTSAPTSDKVSELDSGNRPELSVDAGHSSEPEPYANGSQTPPPAAPSEAPTALPPEAPTVLPPEAPSPALDAGPEEPSPDPIKTLDASSLPMSAACRDDSDCGLSALHCDYQTGVCFECVLDADCSSLGLDRCDVALHRCVECGVDQDCPDGFSCDSTSRSCLPQCESDADCPATAHACEDQRAVCIQCDQDWECVDAGFPYCGLGGASCVECREDAHCEAPLLCDTLVGSCVECRNAFDCEVGASCDPSSHTCVRPPVMDPRSL